MTKLLFVFNFLLFNICITNGQNEKVKELLSKKRLVIIMFDGFGMNYYKNAPMPFLKSMERNGYFKVVEALMPSVTNTNNASICCGNFPDQNGITGNSFLDSNGKEEYMERDELLLSPTLFEKLNKIGIKSALISSKKKSIGLLSRGTAISVSAEIADSLWTVRLGKAPDIYSPEINFWTMRAAIEVLKSRPDIRCLYIHTTDYPMHMWAPEDSNSLKHLMTMDSYIEQVSKVAPDAMIMLTADHDLNHKNRCVDIEQTLQANGVKIKMAISAERDKYLKHHRGFGGTSYVYLNDKNDAMVVKNTLLQIKGVKTVLSNLEATQKYHLMSSRIGDFVVLADSLTAFGSLENKKEEILPSNFRTHGSEYELQVPLVIYRAPNIPSQTFFQYNKDIANWLFEEN